MDPDKSVEYDYRLKMLENSILYVDELRAWQRTHELDHKDYDADIKEIKEFMRRSDERYLKDKEIAEKEKQASKGKALNWVKSSKEVLTFIVLIFGVISAVSLWFYKEAQAIEAVKTHVEAKP
jgi:hypothetical protein